MSIKIYKQSFGSFIALAIEGPEAEVEAEIMALYNWNIWGREKAVAMDTRDAGEDTPYETVDGYKYVYSTEQRLRRGLAGRAELKLINNNPELAKMYTAKRGREKVRAMAAAEMKRTIRAIETKTFLR